MDTGKKIWNYKVEEIVKGFAETEGAYLCTKCGKAFEKGTIMEMDGQLFDAFGAVSYHGKSVHGKTVDYLLEQDGNLTGLSDVQRKILSLMSAGCSDQEVAAALGIAASTVRSHRFKFREKEKQARLFLALMKSLEEKTNSSISMSDKGEIGELHSHAAMVDERFAITQQDREKTIKNYMDENGALKQFPAREKKKIILLQEIMKNFKADTDYTEKEVNRILKRIYEEDYPTLRRALIEYGFMDRAADCSIYRVRK